MRGRRTPSIRPSCAGTTDSSHGLPSDEHVNALPGGRTSVHDEVALAEQWLRTSLAAIRSSQANPHPRSAIARGQVFQDDRTGWRVRMLTLYLERGNAIPQPARRKEMSVSPRCGRVERQGGSDPIRR